MHLDALGLPSQKLKQFERKGITTVEELAQFFPRKYIDFRTPRPLNALPEGELVSIVATVQEVKQHPKFIQVKVKDDTNHSILITWFNQNYVERLLAVDRTYIFCGKVTTDTFYGGKRMTNPLYFSTDIAKYARIMPIYSKISGMSDDYLQGSVQKALSIMSKSETVERAVLRKFNLMSKAEAYLTMHNPDNEVQLNKAQERFIFDDLFEFAMHMESLRKEDSSLSSFVMNSCETIRDFLKTLPFELTEGQRQALRATYLKMRSGNRLNALVQGDVGCGKTIVGIILMLIAKENGYQSALMAPTNVLAKQHYEDLKERVAPFGYTVAFLSGDMKAREKKQVLKGLANGEIDMVVGTHALLSKDVSFKNLALTIVDEEHRFGVEQRNTLKAKAKEGVHHVSMSATPIPRSLALAVYGDSVDVLTIQTMPKGRIPVKTVLRTDEVSVYEGMYKEISKGRQAYIVCPLIEDSDAEAMQDVDSVEKTYEKVTAHFKKYPEVRIGMITGRMKSEVIAEEIDKFSRHELDILISTTIIEVGVNVPNASTIVIKNAERFGLAQLHQLRGRVGRGSYASYCVLLSEKDTNEKLIAMTETTNGFKIAEKDLQFRGTGDFIGTKQTGQNKYVLLMLANAKLYEAIQQEVRAIYSDSERLSFYELLYDWQIKELAT